jgi:hypothetical protein
MKCKQCQDGENRWKDFDLKKAVANFATSTQTIVEFMYETIIPYLIYQEHYKYCSQRLPFPEDIH